MADTNGTATASSIQMEAITEDRFASVSAANSSCFPTGSSPSLLPITVPPPLPPAVPSDNLVDERAGMRRRAIDRITVDHATAGPGITSPSPSLRLRLNGLSKLLSKGLVLDDPLADMDFVRRDDPDARACWDRLVLEVEDEHRLERLPRMLCGADLPQDVKVVNENFLRTQSQEEGRLLDQQAHLESAQEILTPQLLIQTARSIRKTVATIEEEAYRAKSAAQIHGVNEASWRAIWNKFSPVIEAVEGPERALFADFPEHDTDKLFCERHALQQRRPDNSVGYHPGSVEHIGAKLEHGELRPDTDSVRTLSDHLTVRRKLLGIGPYPFHPGMLFPFLYVEFKAVDTPVLRTTALLQSLHPAIGTLDAMHAVKGVIADRDPWRSSSPHREDLDMNADEERPPLCFAIIALGKKWQFWAVSRMSRNGKVYYPAHLYKQVTFGVSARWDEDMVGICLLYNILQFAKTAATERLYPWLRHIRCIPDVDTRPDPRRPSSSSQITQESSGKRPGSPGTRSPPSKQPRLDQPQAQCPPRQSVTQVANTLHGDKWWEERDPLLDALGRPLEEYESDREGSVFSSCGSRSHEDSFEGECDDVSSGSHDTSNRDDKLALPESTDASNDLRCGSWALTIPDPKVLQLGSETTPMKW